MGLISIGGLGSGLDVKSIVDALVTAEKTPKTNSLDRLETDVTLTLSGLGALNSSLDDLKSAALSLSLSSNFSQRSVSVSDQSFYTATASTTASPGSYNIEVESLAAGSKHETQIFTSGSSTTFGDGTLTFTVGVNTFDVAVSATDTLDTIRDNINAVAGNDGLVSVNLLNNVSNGVDTGSVLTFNSSTTGAGNDLVITYSGDASLADLAPGVATQSASDASIKVDGLTATSATNKFTDIIQDVTIDVSKTHATGITDSLDITLDTAGTKSLISGFVDAFNAFVDVSKQLGSANTDQPGLLVGDYTLRQASSQIRNLFSSPITTATGSFNTLSSIGISTKQDGTLEIDNDTLDAAIESDFEKLDELFSGDNGFATKLRDLVDNYTGVNGVITSREQSLNDQLGKIADDRISLSLRIEQLELRLTKQFATMDAIVAQLNSTQSYIKQQFENLPGFSSGKNK
ncbi:flagellar filament capping protein FliD [Aliikangiella sp. IMCC44359]|uniref:flagellar filament capping protein FliD n=1 Tax=Aliikangiella sp. IMCC44359 TaxID=3459125 RepID=UPI00403A7D07